MASKLTNSKLGTNSGLFTFALDTPSLSSGTLDKYLKSVLGTESSATLPELLKQPENEATTSSTSLSTKNPEPRQVTATTIDSSVVPTTPVETETVTTTISDVATPTKPIISSNTITTMVNSTLPLSTTTLPTSTALTESNQQLNELAPSSKGQQYIDITEYLSLPQSEAAKRLDIPPSTLSKRWKEAVRKRKWPYRMICKIDKEIMTLLHNVPQGPNAPPLSEEIEAALGQLLRKRQEELRSVVIRL